MSSKSDLWGALLITLCGLVGLSHATHGLRAFTAEGHRKISIRETKPQVDWVTISKQITSGQRVTLLTFMYTGCKGICSIAAAQFQRLNQAVQTSKLTGDILLLSISFDPLRDTPAALKQYAKSLSADPSVWRFVALENTVPSQLLLKQLGVVVLPDGFGEFEHNAAIYVVNASGQLIDVFAIDEPEYAFQAALRQLDESSF